MKDFFRTLFGIRKQRRALPMGRRPPVEAVLLRGNVKMRVTHAMTSELWDWLQLSGWRENTYRNDRRQYATLPDNALQQLIAADSVERESVHRALLSRAKIRQVH